MGRSSASAAAPIWTMSAITVNTLSGLSRRYQGFESLGEADRCCCPSISVQFARGKVTSAVGAIALGTEISEYVRGVALDSAVCSCPLLAEWTMSQENIDKVAEDAKIEQLAKLIEYEEKLRAVESDETRKSRRNVLIASLIGIGMSVTGAVPKKIEALDIEFDANNRFAFLFLIAAVIAYFMISLSINYYSDQKTGGRLFRAYGKIINEQLRKEITQFATVRYLIISGVRQRDHLIMPCP
jgi:hypothetical protein